MRDYDLAINTRADKNDIIDDRIEMLNNWISALEEIKTGRAESRVLREKGISISKFRHFLFCEPNYYEKIDDPVRFGMIVLANGAERMYAALTKDELLTTVPSDIEKVAEYCLKNSGLNKREIAVLRMRYWEELTLEDVGKIFNITRERVRQVEAKAQNKIRHRQEKILRYGMLGHDIKRQEALERALSNKEEYLNRQREYLGRKAAVDTLESELNPPSDTNIDTSVYFMSFEEFAEMKNFSVRLTNCIRRSRFRHYRVCDFEKVSLIEIKGISHMGVKSVEEFVNALNEHNINLLDTNYSDVIKED